MPVLDAVTEMLGGIVRAPFGNEKPGDRPGLTSVIDIVTGIGRSLHEPDPAAIYAMLPHLAAARETIENGGGIEQSPWAALANDKAEPFAAGSLWAASVIAHAILDEAADEERRRQDKAGRAELRDIIMDLARRAPQISPATVREALAVQGRSASPSTVSKAIGDLQDLELLEPAPAPDTSDRRQRWYQPRRTV